MTTSKKTLKKNPGFAESFFWPTTHAQAEALLEDFLEHRLREFGPYQDAIDSQKILFVSLITLFIVKYWTFDT